MKKAHINENGQLLGWYDTEIHTEIPTPNIEVSDEQWQIAINSGHNKVNQNGSTEYFDFRSASEQFTEAKNAKLAELSKAYQDSIRAMTGNTDSAEMASWTKQEAEARAWVADNNTLTPIIDNLLIGRSIAGESKASLVNTIIAKADGYAQGYALVLGMYHAKQKQLAACTTVAEVVAL